LNAEILITGDGSPTLSLKGTGETYHSRYGALAESRHIFIEHGLNYARPLYGKEIHVFELGFGTGLNAALTLLKSAEWELMIFYHSLELFPLSEALINSCAGFYSPEIRDALLSVNDAAWNGPVPIGAFFSITKENMDFLTWQPGKQYQVVYYDAFAPAVIPQLWTADCFRKLAGAMIQGAALVTFCAKGEVRRAMRESNFDVKRLPGAPGKREMTRAIRL
jgi:tRNA U34 5-methylaminomethyl-2-thiouridine-forming methyltransferase MnmC